MWQLETFSLAESTENGADINTDVGINSSQDDVLAAEQQLGAVIVDICQYIYCLIWQYKTWPTIHYAAIVNIYIVP